MAPFIMSVAKDQSKIPGASIQRETETPARFDDAEASRGWEIARDDRGPIAIAGERLASSVHSRWFRNDRPNCEPGSPCIESHQMCEIG